MDQVQLCLFVVVAFSCLTELVTPLPMLIDAELDYDTNVRIPITEDIYDLKDKADFVDPTSVLLTRFRRNNAQLMQASQHSNNNNNTNNRRFLIISNHRNNTGNNRGDIYDLKDKADFVDPTSVLLTRFRRNNAQLMQASQHSNNNNNTNNRRFLIISNHRNNTGNNRGGEIAKS